MSIEGPSKVDINCEDMEDGTCKVTYCPTEPGNYIINIKFTDKHIPGYFSSVSLQRYTHVDWQLTIVEICKKCFACPTS